MYRFIFLYRLKFYMYRFIFLYRLNLYAELFIVMFKESCLVLSIGDGNPIKFYCTMLGFAFQNVGGM